MSIARELFKVIDFAQKYYSKEDFDHCMRVAKYINEEFDEIEGDPALYLAVAILHDILEDTEATEKDLYHDIPLYFIRQNLLEEVKLLTKSNHDSYESYIEKIFKSEHKIAKRVKRADMKDHLNQTATLTDKLKEKYYPVIKYML